MPMQQNDYLCGPASLQKALRTLGSTIGQARVAKLCGTEEDEGTDEEDIKRGILSLGYTFSVCHTDIWNEAIAWLDTSLGMHGAPCLLSVRLQEAYDHWVCVFGALGPQGDMIYCVFDPANEGVNLYESGHNTFTRKQLLQYWRAPVKERNPEIEHAYYGISVHKKEK